MGDEAAAHEAMSMTLAGRVAGGVILTMRGTTGR